MDVCDPNTSIKEIREAIRRNTGLDDVKLSREQICDIKSRIDGGLILAPPLMLSNDRRFMRDPKTPLTRSDYEKLFNTETKKASLVRIAKKVRVAIDEDDSTKEEIIDAIHSKLRLLKIAEPVELAKRKKQRTRAVNRMNNNNSAKESNANDNSGPNARANNNSGPNARVNNTSGPNARVNNTSGPNVRANNNSENRVETNNRRPRRGGGFASFLFGSPNRRRRPRQRNDDANNYNYNRPRPRPPRRSFLASLFGGGNANAKRTSTASWEQNSRMVREARRRVEQQQDEFERKKRDMGRAMNSLKDETEKFKRERDRRDDEIRYLRKQQYDSKEEREAKDAKIKQAEQELRAYQVKLEMAKQTRERIQRNMNAQKVKLDNETRKFQRNKRLLENKMKEQANQSRRDMKRLKQNLARAQDPTEKRELEKRLRNASNKLTRQRSEFERQERRRAREANQRLSEVQRRLNAASDPTEKNSLRREIQAMKESATRAGEEARRRIKELEGELASKPTVSTVYVPTAPPSVAPPRPAPNTRTNNNAPRPASNTRTNNAPRPASNTRTNNAPRPASNIKGTNKNNNAGPNTRANKNNNDPRRVPTPTNKANPKSKAVQTIRGFRLPRGLESSIIGRLRFTTNANVENVVTLARETKRLEDQLTRLRRLTPEERQKFLEKMLANGTDYNSILQDARTKNDEVTRKSEDEEKTKRRVSNTVGVDRVYLDAYMKDKKHESASDIDENDLREKVEKDKAVANSKAKVAPRGWFGGAAQAKLVYIRSDEYKEALEKAEEAEKKKNTADAKKKKEKEDREKLENEAKGILNAQKDTLPNFERQRLYGAWSVRRNTAELKKRVDERVKIFKLAKEINWPVEKIDAVAKKKKINASSDNFENRIKAFKSNMAEEKRQAEADKEQKRSEKQLDREVKAELKRQERAQESAAREKNANRLKNITGNDLTDSERQAIMKKWRPNDRFNLNKEIEAVRAKKRERIAKEEKKQEKKNEQKRRREEEAQKKNDEEKRRREAELENVQKRTARGEEISKHIAAVGNLSATAKEKLVKELTKNLQGKRTRDQWLGNEWEQKVDERVNKARENAKVTELLRTVGGRRGGKGQWTEKEVRALVKSKPNLSVKSLRKELREENGEAANKLQKRQGFESALKKRDVGMFKIREYMKRFDAGENATAILKSLDNAKNDTKIRNRANAIRAKVTANSGIETKQKDKLLDEIRKNLKNPRRAAKWMNNKELDKRLTELRSVPIVSRMAKKLGVPEKFIRETAQRLGIPVDKITAEEVREQKRSTNANRAAATARDLRSELNQATNKAKKLQKRQGFENTLKKKGVGMFRIREYMKRFDAAKNENKNTIKNEILKSLDSRAKVKKYANKNSFSKYLQQIKVNRTKRIELQNRLNKGEDISVLKREAKKGVDDARKAFITNLKSKGVEVGGPFSAKSPYLIRYNKGESVSNILESVNNATSERAKKRVELKQKIMVNSGLTTAQAEDIMKKWDKAPAKWTDQAVLNAAKKARKNAKLAELKRTAGGRVSKAGRGGQWTDKTIEEAAKSLKKEVVNLTVNDLQKIEAKAQKTNTNQRTEEKKRRREAELQNVQKRTARGEEISKRIAEVGNLNAAAKEKLVNELTKNLQGERTRNKWLGNGWEQKIDERVKKAKAKAQKKAEKEAKAKERAAEKEAKAKERAAEKEAKAKERAAEKEAKAQKKAEKEAKAKERAAAKATNSFKFGTARERAQSAEPRIVNNGNSDASTTTKKKRSQGQGVRVGGSRVKPRKKSSATPKRTPSSRQENRVRQLQQGQKGYVQKTKQAFEPKKTPEPRKKKSTVKQSVWVDPAAMVK